MIRRLLIILAALLIENIYFSGDACTSAIVSGRLTKSGRPIVWKNRDTGVEDNFIAHINPTRDGEYRAVGLFNAGDSLLRDAWAGFNEVGLAIMNTASYNLAPDTASFVDQEGAVMKRALLTCRTLRDFENLLDTLPKPMGIQANFGVIDCEGNGAYYEANDYVYTKYDLAETEGIIIRTNYSYSGTTDAGYGYIRENNARHLLKPYIASRAITPEVFTDVLSRSFYHSLLDVDYGANISAKSPQWIVDQDFIPRYTSTASVAFELPLPDEAASSIIMWVELGYPPCSWVKAVTIDNIPIELTPDSRWHSSFCDEVVARKAEVFPIVRGSGSHYINASRLFNAEGTGYNQTGARLSHKAYQEAGAIRRRLNKK